MKLEHWERNEVTDVQDLLLTNSTMERKADMDKNITRLKTDEMRF